MTSLHASEFLLCLSALASFSWGMARFFRKPSGHTRHTRIVAVLGLGFAAWHLTAIASAAPVLWSGVAAICLYLASIGLFFWAVRACRQQPLTAIFETDRPEHLVTVGPYRFIRHPFYSSYILAWVAGYVASHSSVALLSIFVMSATYVWAARNEEAKFRGSPLATAHAAYCRRTGFMIPGWCPDRFFRRKGKRPR